jgi:colanic acid/amylovoran biosynthesis glycosyltransferase
MRVALVVNRYPVPSQTFIRTQFEGLRGEGVDCRIVDKAIDPRFASDRQPRIVGVERLAVLTRPTHRAELALRAAGSALVRPTLVRRDRAAARSLDRRTWGSHWLTLGRLAALDPHLIHYSFASYAVGEEHVGRSLGVPLVVSCRGYDLTHVGVDVPGYYRRLWEAVDLVHFRSRDLLELALQRGFSPTTPHRITPPGVDAAFFAPARNVTDARTPMRVLSIGRLVAKKGHEVGLDAIRQLRAAGVDVTYEIVGDGDRRAELERVAVELGVAEVTDFRGELGPVQVRERLRAADVLLHPSWQEGFGVSVLEAQATGLPVVCTAAEGLAENVEDGVTGAVVARGDASAMASELARILLDRDLARRMGRAGRARVLELFTIEREITSYLHGYEALLGRGVDDAAGDRPPGSGA